MLKILSSDTSMKSAMLLRDQLQKLTGHKIWVTKNPDKINTSPFIRYGSTAAVKVKETEFNSADFIRFCSNKLSFSRRMEEHEIYSPKYYRNKGGLIYPLLIRETLSSFGCKGIHIIENQNAFYKLWKDSYWWTPYIMLDFELRVHMLGKDIGRIFKKELEKKQDLPIRNNDLCHFSLRNISKYPKLDEFIERMQGIPNMEGGGFYSIDIGWDAKRSEYFAIELNSASGLNENTAEMYAQYIFDNL